MAFLRTWTNIAGTTDETGGYVELKSPGTHGEILSPSFQTDSSNVVAPASYSIVEGAGDFTALSVWDGIIPGGPGGYYAMQFSYHTSPTDQEYLVLSLSTLSTEVADLLTTITGITYPAGTSAALSLVNLDLTDFSVTYLAQESLILTSGDFTGDVRFRFQFSDSTNDVVGSFSSDGGSSYHDFSTVTSNISAFGSGSWALLGDPITLIEAMSCGELPLNNGSGLICDGTPDGATCTEFTCDAGFSPVGAPICNDGAWNGNYFCLSDTALPALGPWGLGALAIALTAVGVGVHRRS
jgi:hypothetical protein